MILSILYFVVRFVIVILSFFRIENSPSQWMEDDILSTIDSSVDPCDNFYEFSCGSWIKNKKLEDDESRFTRSFSEIAEKNYKMELDLIKDLIDGSSSISSSYDILNDFLSSCMDTTSINKYTFSSLIRLFEEFHLMGDEDSSIYFSNLTRTDNDVGRALFMKLLGSIHSSGFSPFFSLSSIVSSSSPSNVIAYLSSGPSAYSLPQSFYADSSEMTIFQDHIQQTFSLFYEEYYDHNKEKEEEISQLSEQAAEDVVFLEQQLSSFDWTVEELRTPSLTNQYFLSFMALRDSFPLANWGKYLEGIRGTSTKILTSLPIFQVQSFAYFEDTFQVLFNRTVITQDASSSPRVMSEEDHQRILENYLRWTILKQSENWMSTKFQDNYFDYFEAHLNGKKKEESSEEKRKEFCLFSLLQHSSQENSQISSLGFLLSKLMKELQYTQQEIWNTKYRILNMIHQFKTVFTQKFNNDWMDEPTVKAANEKLSKISSLILFPEDEANWNFYFDDLVEDYEVNKATTWVDFTFFEWKRAIQQFGKRKSLELINTQTNKKQWEMIPMEVNAYYEPTLNEVCFPAGILQYPFYHSEFSEAMLYGSVGVVIGHELTHGYDDEGSQYDSTGRFENWWSEETRAEFENKTKCFVEQYSNYSPLSGSYVNGELTLGENLADFNGLSIAYDALKRVLGGEEGMKEKSSIVSQFTEEQLFFISFGQIWCSKEREESLKQRILLDPHSPAEFRVKGVVSNHPQFAKAFQCSENSKMNPQKKCSLY